MSTPTISTRRDFLKKTTGLTAASAFVGIAWRTLSISFPDFSRKSSCTAAWCSALRAGFGTSESVSQVSHAVSGPGRGASSSGQSADCIRLSTKSRKSPVSPFNALTCQW